MKRCPECRRDYYDDSLLYCLDDGTALLEGPGSGEAKTSIMPKQGESLLGKPKWMIALGSLVLAVTAFGVWWLLGPGTARPAANKAPSQAGAENYVRARVLMQNENKEDVDAAVNLLERVVEENPEFAAAWAVLARGFSAKAFYFATTDEERKQLNLNAEVAVERALTLDPNLGEAHFARGIILWTHAKRFPHEQAIQSYKRALELDPKLDEAHHQLGLIYLHLGLFDKAQAHLNKALEINPGNTLARFRGGVVALYQRRYEDAYQIFHSTPLEKSPSFHAFQTATALFNLGKVDEAGAMIDTFLRDYPADEGGLGTSVRAMVLAKKGQTAEAEQAIERADKIGRNFGHFHHAAYNIACAYAILGKAKPALEYLQKAADDGLPCYPLFANDENLDRIRGDSEFIALLAKMKQQWDRYNATL